MTWQQDIAAFARKMDVQHIGYWRQDKSDGLPITAAWNRKMALHYLRKAKELDCQ